MIVGASAIQAMRRYNNDDNTVEWQKNVRCVCLYDIACMQGCIIIIIIVLSPTNQW